MDTTDELHDFEYDSGVFVEVAGTIDPLSPVEATRGRDSQGVTAGSLDEVITDAMMVES